MHFKGALARDPDDPFTLNYLGYWWAESGRHLTQAIELIEQAVRLRPDSGFFVDSLGWVHYQLGNYQLAVEFLEKATMLEPEDAVIIAHLGDAYWQTNRYNEAQYKWRYAAQITKDSALHKLIWKISWHLDYQWQGNEPMITLLAPAKVNLCLRVYGKTDSGLHNLDSIVVFCQFGDKISISLADHDSFCGRGPFAPSLTATGNRRKFGNRRTRRVSCQRWCLWADRHYS